MGTHAFKMSSNTTMILFPC